MTLDHPAAQALLSVIKHRIVSHPRGLQTKIGPSEFGHPCTRWLGYKLAGAPEVNPKSAGWRPTVGVAVHEWLAKTFSIANKRLLDATGLGQPVWLVEHRLACGRIEAPDGYEVHGSCDLYYLPFEIAVDWKIVGKTTLDDARKKGPSEQYRVQAHSYGRGWARLGMPIKEVAVFYLPASGELSDAVWWSEPYDEGVVTHALKRVAIVQSLVHRLGVSAVEMLPTAEHYCNRCPYWKFESTDVKTACPGDPEARVNKPDPLTKLM